MRADLKLKWFALFLGIILSGGLSSLYFQNWGLKKVAIYKGPGACDGCPEALASVVQGLGHEVEFVAPADLNSKLFSRIRLFVQPGGSDRLKDTLEVLSPESLTAIRDYVLGGGKFLGVCAGAYLAAQWTIDEKQKISGYNLLPGYVVDEEDDVTAKLKLIRWQNQTVPMYFQDGPNLDGFELADAEVWAYYADTGHKAALFAKAGKGFVGLLGPHPEATPDWFEEDHVEPPEKLSLDLAKAFVKRLLDEP
jgi:glutamine amidotransferase-like uncharacterized protein